jgi:hypothetical protein
MIDGGVIRINKSIKFRPNYVYYIPSMDNLYVYGCTMGGVDWGILPDDIILETINISGTVELGSFGQDIASELSAFN